MRNLTQFIKESKNGPFTRTVTEKELEEYSSLKLSREITALIKICLRNQIFSGKKLLEIKDVDASTLKGIKGYNADYKVIKNILNNKKIFSIETDLKILPQFQTEDETTDILKGVMGLDEITLDFDSRKGREMIVLKYTPLVHKIVNYYKDKTSLSEAELISGAMFGLNEAIDSFKKNYNKLSKEELESLSDEEREILKKQKKMNFLGYASIKIRMRILNDINEYSRTVKIPYYGGGQDNLNNAVYVDQYDGFDEEDRVWAHVIGDADKMIRQAGERSAEGEGKVWKKLFDVLGNKFSKRDIDIFKSSFGLGENVEKGKDIAKKYGITAAQISQIRKNIIRYIQSNKELSNILQDLYAQYLESLSPEFVDKSKEEIFEVLCNDENYILLYESKPSTLSDEEICKKIKGGKDLLAALGKGFEYLDAHYKALKSTIIDYLRIKYPGTDVEKMSDVEMLNLLNANL